MNDLLGKVFDNLLKVNTCYDCFVDFKERFDIVHREWTVGLDSLLKKLQCSDLMEQVLKTFGVVEACLETWDFQSCAWVRGDKADPDIESLSKKAEVVFMQFETWRDVLATVSKNLAHATQEQNESVAAVMACTSAVQDDIGKAKIAFCTVLLTSALLKG